MTARPKLKEAVYKALNAVNETLAPEEQLDIDIKSSLMELDSLGVTNLVVAVEDAVRSSMGLEISLTGRADPRTSGIRRCNAP